MRNNSEIIEFGSAEFNAMFTPDGKLDFNARRGMKREDDPLDRLRGRMEQPDFGGESSNSYSLRYDNDVDVNEDW